MDRIILKKVLLPNGETYAYREKGTGDRTIVLVHGNLSSSILWDILMEELPGNEYRIIAPDLRGFGDSSYIEPISTVKDFSEDLRVFADTLSLKKFVLMGWSLGGLIALQFTADHQDYVSHLALMGTSAHAIAVPKLDSEGKAIQGSFWSTQEDIKARYADIRATLANRDSAKLLLALNTVIYIYNKPAPTRYRRYLEEIFKQRNKFETDYATVQFNISHEHNGITQGTGEIDRITCPTLIFQGDSDIVTPVVYGEKLREEIGDNAKLVMLHQTGHSPLVDSLNNVVQELLDFIRGD